MKFSQTILEILDQRGLESPPEDLIKPICICVWEEGHQFLNKKSAHVHKKPNEISQDMAAFFQEWYIVLTPTLAKPTPLIEEKDYLTISDNSDIYDWFNNLWSTYSYTLIANICGSPGISLPMLGMQLLTKQGDYGLLLQKRRRK